MPQYEFTALNPHNQILRGQVSAWTKRGAQRQLRDQQATIVTLRRVTGAGAWRKLLPNRVTNFDRIVLTRSLVTMLRAGMNLTEALASCREQMSNQTLQRVLSSIEQSIQAGQTLSSGMKRYPSIFTAEYIAIVTIGEQSGKLVDVLTYLVKKLEDEHRLLRRIRQALTYPAIIVVTMLLIVAIMVLFVIPRVATIYTDAGVRLPLLTRGLISASTFLSHYFLWIFFSLLAVVLLLDLLLRRSLSTRRFFHRGALRLPHFGQVMKKLNLAMVSRSMSMLLQAGLPIDRSLKLAAETARNVSYRDALQWSEPLVVRGVHLSDAFRGRPELFLPVFRRMIATGEQTGNLDTMFANVAKYYDDDLEYWAANVSAVIEPAMIIGVAVVVAGIALAILFPLWNLVNVIQ